ncbi:hypothetical protein V8C86DRAFT_1793508 [Haematococcus lacustris]
MSGQDEGVGVFECNICLELASEPVVTLCGHLYCWPCLFRWMQLQSYAKQCPVCKAGVDDDTVIPIYGRGNENPTPAYLSDDKLSSPAPARPAGQRPAPVLLQPPAAGTAPGSAQPGPRGTSIFGFQLGPGQGYVEALTPEQQHQAFLSRLLLMLGSFVIMCLLLF